MFYVGLALALGITGGLLFHYLNLPLPWLLGALWATLVASIARMPPAFEFVISNSTAMSPLGHQRKSSRGHANVRSWV